MGYGRPSASARDSRRRRICKTPFFSGLLHAALTRSNANRSPLTLSLPLPRLGKPQEQLPSRMRLTSSQDLSLRPLPSLSRAQPMQLLLPDSLRLLPRLTRNPRPPKRRPKQAMGVVFLTWILQSQPPPHLQPLALPRARLTFFLCSPNQRQPAHKRQQISRSLQPLLHELLPSQMPLKVSLLAPAHLQHTLNHLKLFLPNISSSSSSSTTPRLQLTRRNLQTPGPRRRLRLLNNSPRTGPTTPTAPPTKMHIPHSRSTTHNLLVRLHRPTTSRVSLIRPTFGAHPQASLHQAVLPSQPTQARFRLLQPLSLVTFPAVQHQHPQRLTAALQPPLQPAAKCLPLTTLETSGNLRDL